MALMANGKKVLGYALGNNVFMAGSGMNFSKISTSSNCYNMNQNTDGSFTCGNNISDYSGDWIIMSFMYMVSNFYSVITTAPFKMNNRIVQEVETDSGGTATIDCTSTYNNNFSFSNSPVYNSENSDKVQLIITDLTIQNGGVVSLLSHIWRGLRSLLRKEAIAWL